MNFLILNWKDIKNPEKGGAEVIAHEFARRLVKDGHSVIFFSRFFRGASKEEELNGIKIIRKGNKFTTYLHAYLFYKSLKKKPDRVIDMVNTICWQTSLYVPREKRVVYVNQLAKEVFFFELPWPLSIVAYFLEKLEYLSYINTRFVCYSNSTKQDLVSFSVKEKYISTFQLGLDHERYKIGEAKSSDPLFIFVARLVRMKRADLCIEAMVKVAKRYPDAKLLIIGSGPDKERLQGLVKTHRLGVNVEFVDKNNFFIDKNTKDLKVGLMQKAWALLLPSVKEGWGMVVTEAAACGTPAIVSNVTGLRDSVIKNKTGLVLSGNPSEKELSDAMLKIIEDNGLRARLAQESILWSKTLMIFYHFK